jgi:hypothetical protein
MRIVAVTIFVISIFFAILKYNPLFIIRILFRYFFLIFSPVIVVQINLLYFCNSTIEFWHAKVCH